MRETATMDAAVEAGAEVLWRNSGNIAAQQTQFADIGDFLQRTYRDRSRAALLAALPHLLEAVVAEIPKEGSYYRHPVAGTYTMMPVRTLLEKLQSAASRLTPPPDGGGA